MPLSRPNTQQLLAMTALLALTAALYWRGLSGPYLFDDDWNLAPIHAWALGKETWLQAVLGKFSLLVARPLSMASFTLTASFGTGPFPHKLGNLVVHLLCGAMIWILTRRIARDDSRLHPRADLVALIVTTFWLLHPLQVSTVLYVVQRMAQLSTLFTLIAIWIYLVARQQAAQGSARKAAANLFLAFPAIVVAGLLSKQNAVIAPLLCLVIELAYYRGLGGKRLISLFFGLSVALPVVAGAALLAVFPDRLATGYAEWPFTLGDRLLTQPRALLDYLSMLLLPRGPLMGLYTDDYVVSTGLLSPPSTLLAIAVLTAVSIAALALRKRAPIVFAGWFFFLGAHLIESSFLPLEMYYEHRNYLPAIGIFWMLVGGLASLPAISTNVLSPRQLGLTCAGLFAAMLAFATFGRVLIWEHKESIVAQGLAHHPDSIRAAYDSAALAAKKGDYETAKQAIGRMTSSRIGRFRLVSNIDMIMLSCRQSGDADPAYLQAARRDLSNRVTIFETQTFKALVDSAEKSGGNCGRTSAAAIADLFKEIIDRAPQQPETTTSKWTARFYLAQMMSRARRWDEAEHQAELAWNNSFDMPAGGLLARLHMRQGHVAEAYSVYTALERRIPQHDQAGQNELAAIRKFFADSGHPIP